MGFFGTLKNIGKTALKVAKPIAAVASVVGVPGAGALNGALQGIDALGVGKPSSVMTTTAPRAPGGFGGVLGGIQTAVAQVQQSTTQQWTAAASNANALAASASGSLSGAPAPAVVAAQQPDWVKPAMMVGGGVVLLKVLKVI